MTSAKSIGWFTLALALALSTVMAIPDTIIQQVNAVQTFNVTISNLVFNPQNLTIQAGDTVTWTNNDPLIYTLWFVKVNDRTTYLNAGKEGLSDPILLETSWSQTFNELVTLQYYSFDRLWITGFITVTPPIPPVASFTHSPTTPLVGQIVTFDASDSYDPDGTITQYSWDFGDGTQLSEADNTSTHAYATAGTYNVKLTVTDDDAQTDTASATVTVNPIIHDIVVVSVTPSPTQVTVGQNVSVSVVVRNDGNATETFSVTTYANDTIISAQNAPSLAAGATTTLGFTWNTAGVGEGDYTIRAVASTVSGETDTADNTGTALSKVKVTKPPPPFPTELLIAAIIIVIAIIVALAYYYFKIVKKKPPKT